MQLTQPHPTSEEGFIDTYCQTLAAIEARHFDALERTQLQISVDDIEKATYLLINGLSTHALDANLHRARAALTATCSTLEAACSTLSSSSDHENEHEDNDLRQCTQRFNALHGLMEEAETMLQQSKLAVISKTSTRIKWKKPGAKHNPASYWDAYCDTERMLFDYLSEEKEHASITLRLYINDMTLYLGSTIYTSLCYNLDLAFQHETQARWLAAALCLHVCRRELQIPWQPEDIVGQVIQQVERPMLSILETLSPRLAALVGGHVLEGNIQYFGQSLGQASLAFLESVGALYLIPVIHEVKDLREKLAPYLDTDPKRYAHNLKVLRDNLVWRTERSRALRSALRQHHAVETQSRFEASMLQVQEEVMAQGDQLADLLEAEIRNNPDFMPDERDRLRILADCDRMRGAARAVADPKAQGGFLTFSQDLEDELASILAGGGNDEKGDDSVILLGPPPAGT